MFWRKEESHVQRAEGYEEARNELKTVGEKYAAYSGIDPDAALQTVNVNEPAGLLTQAEKTGTMALEE